MNNAANPQSDEKSIEAPSYEVDALLQKLGVVANNTIWKKIDSVIRVQGLVGKVKPYKNVVYFDLRGGEGALTVKTSLDMAPREGDRLVVEGLPILRASKFFTGLDVQIEGRPVANWEPLNQEHDSLDRFNLHKSSYHTLHSCLSNTPLEKFGIFGTETAIRDVLSNLPDDSVANISTHVVRVSDQHSMVEDIAMAVHCFDAFAVVRGGDDASLEIWNRAELVYELLALDMPFYLALGHSHRVTLANQYADESFPTPSAFGSSMKGHIQGLEERERMRQSVDELQARCLDYEVRNRSLLNAEQQLLDAVSSEKRKRRKAIFFAVITILIVGFYSYLT